MKRFDIFFKQKYVPSIGFVCDSLTDFQICLQDAETLRLEVEELKGSIEKAKEEITTTEAKIEELQQRVS